MAVLSRLMGIAAAAAAVATVAAAPARGRADADEGEEKAIMFERSYEFDGRMPRNVLESYLSRAITMMDLMTGKGDVDDNVRMLTEIGVKFAGRAVYRWGSEGGLAGMLPRAAEIASRVHAADPEMILQAGIFEIATTDIEKVEVPAFVFREFGLEPEARSFRYPDMLFEDGRLVDHWGEGRSVPDMSRLETRMWFYRAAAAYIDAGCEAIHFGQVALIGANDPDMRHWWDMLTRVRGYAAEHARRHFVLCDAHVPTGGRHYGGEQLLFDFHSFPLRIATVAARPQEGELRRGYIDSIYGRSKGGLTPSGWRCESLPYLAELDNWGSSGREGEDIGDWWTWGYDEISWFAHQPGQYRDRWLRYAWNRVRELDANGWLQMPGSRCLASPLENGLNWYYANRRSTAVPDGYGDEDTIREIWAAATP